MSYQVLARKWRPNTFQELTGQGHVSKTIENAIKSERIAHAYLFSGVRGVGKTTVARILAKSLNCAEGPTAIPCMKCQSCHEITGGYAVDVVEIDGASHTGVDNIRELQENAQYAPLRGRYKIYIIDEVHMLSTSAFNALLKILEEPPPHIVFIFATTEPHKIPATIHSRCQTYQFRRISYKEIMERLQFILHEEGIKAGESALSIVARASDGSMRDALSLLDQVIAYTGENITDEDVAWILGTAEHLTVHLIQHILNKDSAGALNILKELSDGGYDIKQFLLNIVEHIRNLTMIKLGVGGDVIDLPSEEIAAASKLAEGVPIEDFQRLFGIFSSALEEMRWFPYPRFSLEMAVIKASNMRPVVPVDDLLAKLQDIEHRMVSGVPPMGLKGGENQRDKNVPPILNLGVDRRGVPTTPEGFSGKASMRVPLTKDDEDSLPFKGRVRVGMGLSSDENKQETSDNQAMPIKDESDLKSVWKSIVGRILERKPSLGSYIEQSIPLGISEGILTIGFNGGASVFITLLDRKDSKDYILEVVKGYMQGVSGIRFTTASDKTENNPAPAYEEYVATAHEKQQEEVDDAFSDPIVQEAIDILGGELVELRNKKQIN
ncbi:MAG: DNA polymerase III subunit gamma/tau [Nitrospirae bacterium]|nr:DNA polymerase III subunit gamma/tau [Nitrospirota bacterium]